MDVHTLNMSIIMVQLTIRMILKVHPDSKMNGILVMKEVAGIFIAMKMVKEAREIITQEDITAKEEEATMAKAREVTTTVRKKCKTHSVSPTTDLMMERDQKLVGNSTTSSTSLALSLFSCGDAC